MFPFRAVQRGGGELCSQLGTAGALGVGPAGAWEELCKTSPLMRTAWVLVSRWDRAPPRRGGRQIAALSVTDPGNQVVAKECVLCPAGLC